MAPSSQPRALTIQSFVYNRTMRKMVESVRRTTIRGTAPPVRCSGSTKFGWTPGRDGNKPGNGTPKGDDEDISGLVG